MLQTGPRCPPPKAEARGGISPSEAPCGAQSCVFRPLVTFHIGSPFSKIQSFRLDAEARDNAHAINGKTDAQKELAASGVTLF